MRCIDQVQKGCLIEMLNSFLFCRCVIWLTARLPCVSNTPHSDRAGYRDLNLSVAAESRESSRIVLQPVITAAAIFIVINLSNSLQLLLP